MTCFFTPSVDLYRSVVDRFDSVVTRLNFVEPVEACIDHMTISTSPCRTSNRMEQDATVCKRCKGLTYADA